MIGITHEIELIDYSVICESSSYIKGALVLGAYENQIDTLHITANDLWENLTVSVAFSAGPLYKKVHMDHNGMVSIPDCVIRHHIPPNRLGKIIFSGTAPNVRRIVVELPYRLESNPIPVDPSDLYAHWPIFNAGTNADFPNLGYANVLYKAEQEATLYQWLETDKRYEPISGQKTDIEPITGISIGGVELTPENGVVPLPQATAERLGFVRSSSDENRIEVLSSGVMEVHSLNVNKLIQTEGDTLVLNSGNSTAI